MATTLTRRSLRELSHHKARAFFTVATIAAAVTGLWLFAAPPLIDAAMADRIERDLLWDLRLSPNGIALFEADFAAIRDLPNVAGVEGRVTVTTQLQAEGREMQAWLVGVDDFAGQEVNAVNLIRGAFPTSGEVLTDPQNARSGRYGGDVGDQLRLGGFPVNVSGVGATIEFSAGVDDADPVFYVPLSGLQDAIGAEIITWIDLRVHDPAPDAVATTAEAVRAYLATVDPDVTYWEVLQVREPGTWPEEEDFDRVITVTYVIAGLALLSALLMVSTTMHTIVREQTRETGILKAVGATRRAIARSYLLTAGVLGGLGTIVGVGLGIALSNLLVGVAGRQFSGVEPSFGVPLWVLAVSVVVGIGVTMLAALPGVWRATAIPVRQALGDHGISSSFGRGRLDTMVGRSRWLPRSFRLGLRNAARRKGRSLATAAQVGLAVGTFLGFLALGITAQEIEGATFDGQGGDLWVRGPTGAATVLGEVEGVADVVPVFYAVGAIEGETLALQGQTPAAAALHPDLEAGRWFSDEEERSGAQLTVLGPAAANAVGAEVGDVVAVETITGRAELEVVGIDALMVEDGDILYTPVSTAIALAGGGAPNNYYVLTAERDEAFIDTVATRVRRALVSSGLGGEVETRYIEREAQMAQTRTIVTLLIILGLPVIAIGMIGLVNTMTMNVIDRTREIGILRSIGARARHIRRMIRAEGLVLGFLGWLAAIPIGYVIGLLLLELLGRGFGVEFDLRYPWWPLLVALAATAVITAVVVTPPVRRAVRMRPGTALRYE
jgi:putative ABC transport system permease protein